MGYEKLLIIGMYGYIGYMIVTQLDLVKHSKKAYDWILSKFDEGKEKRKKGKSWLRI